MTVEVRHSPPPLHQPGDVITRPKGILKNPSFSGSSGPGVPDTHQTSPTKSTSPEIYATASTPLFNPEDAKDVTLQNTLQNAGPRRSSSAARRASASRRQSSFSGADPNDPNAMRLKWDEANLYLAEQDAGTRMKITEPKTPYQFGDQGAMQEEDEDDVAIDPRYVNVDEVEMAHKKGGIRRTRESEIPGLELGEPEEDPAVADVAGDERVVRGDAGRGSITREYSSGSGKHVSVSSGSGEGMDGEGVGMPTKEDQEKHRLFEERRKQHYEMKNMKGVLGNPDLMDEDEPSGEISLPERNVNGMGR